MKTNFLPLASLLPLAALAACSDGGLVQPMPDDSPRYEVIASSDYVCTLNSSFVVTVFDGPDEAATAYPRQATLVLNAGVFQSGTTEDIPPSPADFSEVVNAASVSGLTFTFTATSNTYFFNNPGPTPAQFTVTGTIDPLTGNVSGSPATYSEEWGPVNRTGTLDWNATGVATCEPAVCEGPAAPAIANAYLKANDISPASAKGKAIISAVAKHMGPGATFDGLRKCDSGYAEAVENFVLSLL